jgi:formate/nitrite transporter FocA (FNT family)
VEAFPTGLILGAIAGATLATSLVTLLCASDEQILTWLAVLLAGWVLGVGTVVGVLALGSK